MTIGFSLRPSEPEGERDTWRRQKDGKMQRLQAQHLAILYMRRSLNQIDFLSLTFRYGDRHRHLG